MDAKAARELIDRVCEELDERRARAEGVAASLARAARPLGLGAMIAIGAAGCTSSGGEDAGPDARVPPAADAYGVFDTGVDTGVLPPGDAYGIPLDAASDTGPSVDLYGIPEDAG